ncbi:hypothetical protein C5167_044084 [Papaver somniferum]|uniref:Uncharacterized protein n=1 Tax=Papaver somniferum TaxID=3469 RepID=A0A4Y7L8G6_PAPSO|nr:hypothetical protein C5167_044084 [Papaver somniferum]
MRLRSAQQVIELGDQLKSKWTAPKSDDIFWKLLVKGYELVWLEENLTENHKQWLTSQGLPKNLHEALEEIRWQGSQPNVPDITVVPPKDDHLGHIIDAMALYVLGGGCSFEQAQ